MLVSSDQPVQVSQLILDFGTKDAAGKFKAEISSDGKEWTPVALSHSDNKTEIQGTSTTASAMKYVRIVNISDDEVQVYFKRFTIKIER